MQYFDFEYLIKKYSTTFTVKTASGSYDDSGDYQKSTPIEKVLTGAIISHRQNKLFRSEGTLTEQDRALYMLTPLDQSLEGAKVIHEGNEYSIGNELQNAEYTGVYAYTLKFVSVFNGGE